MKTWEDKVNTIIAKYSTEAYLKAGNTFPPKKKHKPYTLPTIVHDLIECLNNEDEERAKAIMMCDFYQHLEIIKNKD